MTLRRPHDQQSSAQCNKDASTPRGLVRLEVQAPKKDADLIRALAETLRSESEKAKALRAALVTSLVYPAISTAFDVFGSDLPDEVFAGVFEQSRQKLWRKIDL